MSPEEIELNNHPPFEPGIVLTVKLTKKIFEQLNEYCAETTFSKSAVLRYSLIKFLQGKGAELQ